MMEFVIACLCGGVGFVILCELASSIFLRRKKRQEDREMQIIP